MADILYTIEYDSDEPFQIPKPEVREIGTTRDRIGFVTTKETAEYLAERSKRVALRRDGLDPFDAGTKDSMPKIYIVPAGKGKAKFFEVRERGKKGAFHLTCGEVGKDDEEFKAWRAKEHPGGHQ